MIKTLSAVGHLQEINSTVASDQWAKFNEKVGWVMLRALEDLSFGSRHEAFLGSKSIMFLLRTTQASTPNP